MLHVKLDSVCPGEELVQKGKFQIHQKRPGFDYVCAKLIGIKPFKSNVPLLTSFGR